jgi:enoyl-CoA hydratase/carnithine racemase
MLTHCDFAYAGESAHFQTPFVNLGLVPEFGSSFSVPARAGHLNAAELFLLGEPFAAARAAELGLVTRVVPDAELLPTARATAQKLASKPVARSGPQSGLSSERFLNSFERPCTLKGTNSSSAFARRRPKRPSPPSSISVSPISHVHIPTPQPNKAPAAYKRA